jgi:hypothetical protein
VTVALAPIVDAAASHALATGRYERVNRHEPKSDPGSGLSAAIWVQRVTPVPTASGLVATTARVELTVRSYANMLTEPQDEIDPTIYAAVDDLMAAYSGDFTLGGLVRDVDLLGQAGEPLGARAGYLSIQGAMKRVMDIALPLIVSDVWTQAP